MTHEYVIGLRGRVLGAGSPDAAPPTAIAWAADAVLAIGSDEAVRALSRGDSTFLDLDGCVVAPLEPGTVLEPGVAADLAFWAADPARIRAIVRRGAFTEGDEHSGPFQRLASPAASGHGP